MTAEEINNIVKSTEDKITEVKQIIDDMNTCKSEKSKTVLLAAASKLAAALAPNATITR